MGADATFDMVLFFISGGGFFTGLFAAVLAWGRSRGNQRANRLLALLLLLGSFNIVHPLVAMLAPPCPLRTCSSRVSTTWPGS